MSSEDYLTLKTRLEEQGAFFHPALFRQTINGIPGLYTHEAIPADECLMRIPKSCTSGFNSERYPADTSLAVMVIHHAASQLQSGAFDHHYYSLDTLSEQRTFSCFFFDPSQRDQCRKMSVTLGRYIDDHNQETQAILEALLEFDDSVSKDLYLETILNYRNRAMGQNGFVPGAVLFNHSSDKGKQLENTKTDLVVRANQAYEAGDEVYVSYGNIDLLRHATSYHYFDDSDQHFLQINKRLTFPIKDPRDQALAAYLGKHMPVVARPIGMFKGFSIEEPSALFGENGPSEAMIKIGATFVQAGVFESMPLFFKFCLEEMRRLNTLDKVDRSTVPTSLHRFYDALNKEKAMLDNSLAALPV